MKKYSTIFFCFIQLIISCRHNIREDNIKIKNGIYIDSLNGEILNGKYRSVSPPDDVMNNDQVSTSEYANGIPIGDWTYTFNGDSIHSGKYLIEESTKSSIQELTKCKRVDLNLWKEGEYSFLSIELVQPMVTDTFTLRKLINVSRSSLFKTYNFKMVIIDSVSIADKNSIYQCDIN